MVELEHLGHSRVMRIFSAPSILPLTVALAYF
jgi:hypothetical protein